MVKLVWQKFIETSGDGDVQRKLKEIGRSSEVINPSKKAKNLQKNKELQFSSKTHFLKIGITLFKFEHACMICALIELWVDCAKCVWFR